MVMPTVEPQGIPAIPTAKPEDAPPHPTPTAEQPVAQIDASEATALPPEPAAVPSKPAALSETSPSRSKSRTHTERWQERLLPLMRGMLIGLTFFFFVVTLIQISYLHYTIQLAPQVDLGLPASDALANQAVDFSEALAARELDILSRLEAAVMERRYHQVSTAIMSGLWLRYMGFITGMILAMVGAAFILGKLREPASEISGKGAGVDFSLRSASPGIILVALAVVLMMATILDRDTYETPAKGIYLPGSPALIQPTDSEIPVLGTPPAGLYEDGSLPDEFDIPGTLPP